MEYAFEPAPSGRTTGPDRYETAAAIARASFADTTSAPGVLTRGDTFPDALVGATLAGLSGLGPILLTGRDSLHPAALSELERRSSSMPVYLLGGPEAIGAAVETELRDRGFDVQRIGGADRCATATQVAGNAPDLGTQAFVTSGDQFADALAAGPFAFQGRHVFITPLAGLHPETPGAVGESGVVADHFAEQRGAPFTHVNLARGDTFPDALAGAPHGGAEDAPILFTESPTELGAATRAWLAAHADQIESIHVFGSTEAVSDAVLADARQAATAD